MNTPKFSNGSIFGDLFIHIFREREKFICIKSDERGIQEEMTDPKLAELPIEKEYSGLLIFIIFHTVPTVEIFKIQVEKWKISTKIRKHKQTNEGSTVYQVK